MNGRMLVKILLLVGAAFLIVAPAMAALTPESVRAWWDPKVTMALLLFGVAVKYWPPLAKLHNDAMGWINTALYILGSLVGGGIAHAALSPAVAGAGLTFVDTIARAVIHSASAMVLYETMGRYALERWLGLKKAVPVAALVMKQGQ